VEEPISDAKQAILRGGLKGLIERSPNERGVIGDRRTLSIGLKRQNTDATQSTISLPAGLGVYDSTTRKQRQPGNSTNWAQRQAASIKAIL
jgi:hypothetical protein